MGRIDAREAEIVEVGDVEMFAVPMPNGTTMTYGVATDGVIYLNGDLHPLGAPQAMSEAMDEGAEWVGTDATHTYFPLPWLAAKCLGDPERTVLLATLERFIRSRG